MALLDWLRPRGRAAQARARLEGAMARRRLRGWQPPAPSWGSMLRIGTNYMQEAPWIAFWPGLAIFVTVLGINLFGDALRDVLDPRDR